MFPQGLANHIFFHIHLHIPPCVPTLDNVHVVTHVSLDVVSGLSLLWPVLISCSRWVVRPGRLCADCDEFVPSTGIASGLMFYPCAPLGPLSSGAVDYLVCIGCPIPTAASGLLLCYNVLLGHRHTTLTCLRLICGCFGAAVVELSRPYRAENIYALTLKRRILWPLIQTKQPGTVVHQIYDNMFVIQIIFTCTAWNENSIIVRHHLLGDHQFLEKLKSEKNCASYNQNFVLFREML